MELNIVLAILGGVVIGWFLAYVRIRAGLSNKEWYFLCETYESLRDGTYEYVEEGSDEDDEN
jgi:hypothetical protein